MRLLGVVLDSCEQVNWPLLNRGTAKNAKDVLDEISGELFKVSSNLNDFSSTHEIERMKEQRKIFLYQAMLFFSRAIFRSKRLC
jgi:hypothetical protein